MTKIVRYQVIAPVFIDGSLRKPEGDDRDFIFAMAGQEGSSLRLAPLEPPAPTPPDPIAALTQALAARAAAANVAIDIARAAGQVSITIEKGEQAALAEADEAALAQMPTADAVALIAAELQADIDQWPAADRVTY